VAARLVATKENSMPTKQQLHEAIDRLPDSRLPAALHYLLYLGADPVTLSLLTAPIDEEPYTEEEQRADAEALAGLERGEGIPHQDVLKEFGL
jgi:hypothetical protein